MSDQDWYTPRELAGLPGMPATHSAVVRRAKRDGWESRRRQGRGGGREYHIGCLPAETRAALMLRQPQTSDTTPEPPARRPRETFTYDREALWAWAETRPESLRERARYKASVMREVVTHRRAGMGIRDAIKAVARAHDLKPATIKNWWYGANGQPGAREFDPADWDAALIERYVGRTATADCSPMAWDFLLKSYLNRKRYAFAKAYRRTEEAAKEHGWALPAERTMLRRLHEEVPREVILFRREGPEALRDTIPPLRRDPRCFSAGEAVTADGLKLDRLWVDFGDEIINTATVWVWQCIGTGRMLAPRMGKTENTDLVRLSAYDLLSICLPSYAQLDNTMAAANKAMTGQSKGRKRFKDRPDDPRGALVQLGIDVHFTDPNHEMTTPGVKPVERAFRDLHEEIANHPRFHNRGFSKATAVSAEEVWEVVQEEIARHNARPNRRTLVCGGTKSFDQAWADSVERNPLRVAPEAQRRMLLLMPEVVHVNRRDGHLELKAGAGPRGKPRYYGPEVARYAGTKVVAHYDPDDLKKPVYVYTLDGRHIGTADRLADTAWNDTNAAREHSKFKRRHIKATKEAAKALDRMSEMEYQALYPRTDQPPEPEPRVVQPRWGRSGRVEIDGEPVDTQTGEVLKRAVGSDLAPEEQEPEERYSFDETVEKVATLKRRDRL